MEEKLPLRHLAPLAPSERGVSEASRGLAWPWAGNKPALVAWETQEILSPTPGRGDISAFPGE